MIVDNKPYVIEYNVRMGDPETQVVMPLLESSLLELLWNATNGQLKNTEIKISPKTAVTVVWLQMAILAAIRRAKLFMELTNLKLLMVA